MTAQVTDQDWEPIMEGWLFRRPNGTYVARIICDGQTREADLPPDKVNMLESMLPMLIGK